MQSNPLITDVTRGLVGGLESVLTKKIEVVMLLKQTTKLGLVNN